jgi:hypothetical protein
LFYAVPARRGIDDVLFKIIIAVGGIRHQGESDSAADSMVMGP